jgi:hypothetical protein
MVKHGVLFEVQSEFLNIICMSFGCKGFTDNRVDGCEQRLNYGYKGALGVHRLHGVQTPDKLAILQKRYF